ncbi:MAG: hypothetical protein WC152_07965, partial [Candidatus Izemoplasmatales bacterium]
NKKTSKTKLIFIAIALIYGFGTIFFSVGYMFFDLGHILEELGNLNMLLDFVFIYATFLSMFFILFRANGYLFHYKDYNILQPLPIKSKTVILAKLSIMLVFIYLIVFTVVSPIIFSYFYHGGFNILKLLLIILLLLVIPLIPLVIFSFISLLISNIVGHLRFGKAFNIIFMFIFFFGIMYFSMTLGVTEENPLLGQMSLLENISKYLITAKWFGLAVDELNILAFLGVIGISLTALYLFVLVIQKLVIKTNQMGTITRTRGNNKVVVSKEKSIIAHIISKEFKKFFNVTIYVFNSGFGPIMMAIGGVAILFFKKDLIEFVDVFEGMNLSFEPIILLILGFLISTVFTSSFSLSLEGKNFWILKSLPIKAETIMFGKMLFNVILCLPVAIFALLMSSIALEFSFLNLVVMIAYIASLCFLSSGLGSIINLYFPKFNYINEAEVVKQSLGAFLGMFGTWLILMLNILLYYFLSKYFDFTILISLNVIVNIALFAGVFFFIKNQAKVIFNKI